MRQDLEGTLSSFLHTEAERLPGTVVAPPGLVTGVLGRALHRRLAGRAVPAIAALAVILVAVGAYTETRSRHNDAVTVSVPGVVALGPVSVPSTALSVLTHTVARAAVLVQRETAGTARSSNSSAIVVAADGSYRELPLPAGDIVALSPDGTQVAYGSDAVGTAFRSLSVLTLSSGRASTFALASRTSGEIITSLVWSPDGTRIAYGAGELPVNASAGTSEGQAIQDAAVIDLATGARTVLPASPMSWSADSKQLLLVPPYASGALYPDNVLKIADLNGKVLRSLSIDSLQSLQLGSGSWSSASGMIASISRAAPANASWDTAYRYTLNVASDGIGSATTSHITIGSFVGRCGVLGWQGATHILVSCHVATEATTVMSVDVANGVTQSIAEITGKVAQVQLPATP